MTASASAFLFMSCLPKAICWRASVSFSKTWAGRRGQVWGMTFPVTAKDDPEGGIARFAEEFKALEKRIDELLLERMDQARSAQARAALLLSTAVQFTQGYGRAFPQRSIWPQSIRRAANGARGLFTSGTQEGTPIDRLLGSMAKAVRPQSPDSSRVFRQRPQLLPCSAC